MAGGIPWTVFGAAVALAVLLAPAAVRVLRRATRLSAVRRGSAVAAWDEVRELVDDFGYGSDLGLTPRQLTDAIGARLDDTGRAALGRLRTAVEAQAFARDAVAPAPADVRRVLWSLRRSAGPIRSAGAWLLPRSLVRPWLPAPEPGD